MLLDLNPVEGRGGHADYRERLLVDYDHAPHHGRVRAEAIPPAVETQDSERMAAGSAVVFRGEQAAEGGPYAQHLKIVAGDKFPLRQVLARRGPFAEPHLHRAAAGQDPFEQVGPPREFLVQRIRRVAWQPAPGLIQVDEFLGMRDRQHPHHERVEERKDRCVGPDAERQRKYGGGREPGTAAQAA
jgi:hypothetical protein